MPSDESWRFESRARSALRVVLSEGYSEDLKIHQLVHIMSKAFEEGIQEGARLTGNRVVPVTDLTHIPEVIEHAGRHRWDKGVCH